MKRDMRREVKREFGVKFWNVLDGVPGAADIASNVEGYTVPKNSPLAPSFISQNSAVVSFCPFSSMFLAKITLLSYGMIMLGK